MVTAASLVMVVMVCQVDEDSNSHGLTRRTPVPAKSATLRVTTVKPCSSAVAAIMAVGRAEAATAKRKRTGALIV